MNEIDEDLWLDSDVSINAVFIISQRSVKAPVNKTADNGDIQFANFVLRHYQEQLLRESVNEKHKLHMAFVYHQNGTEALDFPDVEHYLTDESDPNCLSIEQNKLFCVDHSIENSDAQTSVATLWLLAMNLLSRQEERCIENNEQTENRVYFISNRDASPKDQRAINSSAERYAALNAKVNLICGYKDTNHQVRNDFDDILKRFSDLKDPWEAHVCYKTTLPGGSARSWVIE